MADKWKSMVLVEAERPGRSHMWGGDEQLEEKQERSTASMLGQTSSAVWD